MNAGISKIPSTKFYSLITLQQSIKIQDKTLESRKRGIIPDTFLFFELENCWTTGRLDKYSYKSDFKITVLDRGGGATYHGAGQLVCYPIIQLAEPLNAKKYLRWLEKSIIEALRIHGLKCHTKEGYTGIWIRDKKIGFIGAKITRGFTKYGFSVNLTCDLRQFDKIISCGIKGLKVTSFETETGKKLLPVKFADTLAKIFKQQQQEGEKIEKAVLD